MVCGWMRMVIIVVKLVVRKTRFSVEPVPVQKQYQKEDMSGRKENSKTAGGKGISQLVPYSGVL
jgi:hypothetical protein